MLRFLLAFCILGICLDVVGQQQHVVKKSSDVVVIKGRSFYLHTVDVGQTLYSISKAYGVDVNEVKEINGKKDNTLSLYEVLKVPYVEAFVRQDENYYYHQVKKGETLYSISRQFGIKPRRILKVNEQYNESLPIGAVVRLPLNEIDRSAIEQEKKTEEVKKGTETGNTLVAAVEAPKAKPEVKPEVKPETKPAVKPEPKEGEKKKPEVKPEVKPETKPAVKPEPKEGEKKKAEVVAVVETEVVSKKEEGQGMPDHLANVVMLGDPYVKIALLLPFNANEYPMVTDSLNYGAFAALSSRSEQFVSFYEGVLLAVDSLKNKGYKIDFHVFDTEKDPAKMNALALKLDNLQPDLIIGPVYASVFRSVLDHLENKKIPMVYPLSSRTENLGQYSNFIQVNASFATLAEKMTGWIARQSANANIINIDIPANGHDEDRKLFDRQMKQIEGVRSFKWDFGANPLADVKRYLLPDRENIIVLPTMKEADVSKVMPALAVYAENYKITVVGFPEWQTFTSVDHENYFKLNTKIFTYSYVDNNSTIARDFAQDFRKYFYAEPNSLAFKAYDMGLFFIELAAKYRSRTLEALEYYHKDGVFSRFNFSTVNGGIGKENQAFYIVNFGSDYQIKVNPLN